MNLHMLHLNNFNRKIIKLKLNKKELTKYYWGGQFTGLDGMTNLDNRHCDIIQKVNVQT